MTIHHLHPADDSDRDDIDAVVHIRSRRRCDYDRRGFDPISAALHLYAETGEIPGWDEGLDLHRGFDLDDGDWAA